MGSPQYPDKHQKSRWNPSTPALGCIVKTTTVAPAQQLPVISDLYYLFINKKHESLARKIPPGCTQPGFIGFMPERRN
jgi:hypothetical protein